MDGKSGSNSKIKKVKMKNTMISNMALNKIMAILFVALLLGTSQVIAADQSSGDEQISLPDVSTKLDLEKQNIEDEAIPDFTQILPDSATNSDDLPVLQDGTDADIALESIAQKTDDVEIPPVYLEGLIGGGYPGIFIGNFNVYQTAGDNPFSVLFSHEAINGYGQHEASEGFNNSETSLIGSKILKISDKVIFDATAEYNTSTWGLQSQSDYFYNMSRQFVGGEGTLTTQFNDIFSLQAGTEASYVNRFAGFAGDIDTTTETIYTGPKLITFSPSLKGIIEKNKLYLDFGGAYKFVSLDSSVDENDGYLQHGQVDTSISYAFSEMVKANAGVGGSYSNNATTTMTVPFYMGIDIDDSFLTLKLKGGMSSNQTDISSLQEKYPYVHFEHVPTEESNWFGTLDVHVPVVQTFATNLTVDFSKTAFGNECLCPDYSEEDASGMYSSVYRDMTVLNSKLSFSMQLGSVGVDAGWNAKWIDKIDDENEHEVFGNISYTTKNGKGGAQLTMVQSIIDTDIPDVGCSAFYHVAQPFQVELSVEDIIMLFTGDDRLIAGDYCGQGGSVSLLMKLFF
jgi:hypothetical protein